MIVILEEKDFYQGAKERTPKNLEVLHNADIVIDYPNKRIIKSRLNPSTTFDLLQKLDLKDIK